MNSHCSWRPFQAELISHRDSTVNCLGKMDWFGMFQNVVRYCQTVKWDWTELTVLSDCEMGMDWTGSLTKQYFCSSFIHYENLGLRSCECMRALWWVCELLYRGMGEITDKYTQIMRPIWHMNNKVAPSTTNNESGLNSM